VPVYAGTPTSRARRYEFPYRPKDQPPYLLTRFHTSAGTLFSRYRSCQHTTTPYTDRERRQRSHNDHHGGDRDQQHRKHRTAQGSTRRTSPHTSHHVHMTISPGKGRHKDRATRSTPPYHQ
jgi:hypothetical protein